MIWPWSKIRDLSARVETMLRWQEHSHATVQAVERALDAERERTRELTRAILEMRREGFQPPPPPVEIPADALPDAVYAAIRQRAKPGTPLWHQLAADAAAVLDADGAPEAAVQAVLAGGDQFDDLIGG